MDQLNPLWKNQLINNMLKAVLAVVWPIVTHVVEVWTLNKMFRGNVDAFELPHCQKIGEYFLHGSHDQSECGSA